MICAGVGWVWLARLASHARLDTEVFHLFSSTAKLSTCPKFKVHITGVRRRTTKIKTTKFNSGSLFQLFTEISTNKNKPLCGMYCTSYIQCMLAHCERTKCMWSNNTMKNSYRCAPVTSEQKAFCQSVQKFIILLRVTPSNGKLGGAWERGYLCWNLDQCLGSSVFPLYTKQQHLWCH